MRLESAAQAIALIACLWFAFAAAWGMFQIPGGGHTGAGSVGVTGAGLAIARFKILYPSTDWYSLGPPAPASYYCHHPFGMFYFSAFFLWIFGRRDFVVHISPVLMSIAIPPLLYGIGRRYRGPAVGAVAACAYVVVPIAIGFANYNNLETPAIFGSLLFFWGHTAHQATRQKRHLAASLLGLLTVCSSDWVGYLMVAPLLGWSMLRAFVVPARWTPRIHFPSYARWWALSAAIAVGTFVLWIGLFMKADKIGDWLSSAEMRSSDGTPLAAVLEGRKNWIDFSFTPLAIWLGKAAVPICVLRALLFRRDEEVYSLSILFGSIVQYVAFKRGADIHIFWPHYFAEYYALAAAQLACTVGDVIRAGGGLFVKPHRVSAIAGWTTLALGLAPSVAMAPDAVRSLPLWRSTGGRYDERGMPRSDIELLTVIRKAIVPRKPPNSLLDLHPSCGWWWEHAWAFGGNHNDAGDPSAREPASSRHPFWLARASGLSGVDQLRIAGKAHVEAYGDVWIVDQRADPAPIDAWRVEEREPNPLEWLLYGSWEPVREIAPAPDPLLTWEWRLHLKQPAALPGNADARDLDDLRVLHNAAVFENAASRSDALRAKIEAQLDTHPRTQFEQGMELIGVRMTRGSQPRLEMWFSAAGPTRSDLSFHIVDTMEARAALSLMPPDTTDREVNVNPSLPTRLWREGFIYKLQVPLFPRIGVERYMGVWAGEGAPRRLDRQPETTVAIVR